MIDQSEQVQSRSDVLETTVHDVHPVSILNRIEGDGLRSTEYTFTEGVEPNSTAVALVVPHAPGNLRHQAWYRTPETALKSVSGVETVRGFQETSRHHMRLILNERHPETRLLIDIVTRLGGHVSRDKDCTTLILSAPVAVVDQIYDFIRATPGLTDALRINPVYESASAREDVDHLVPVTNTDDSKGEECTLRITGDAHGSPDIGIVRHLETERERVRIVSLSRRPVLPGSTQFEMMIILRATKDPRVLRTLPPALVSDHVGVYSATPVSESDALQYVQIVAPDLQDAKTIVRSQRYGLQTRHRRMDGRPVVTGSVRLSHAPKLKKLLSEVPFPRTLNVPLIPTSLATPSSGHTTEWYREMGEGYHRNMRQLLLDLLPEEEREQVSSDE